jgi:hypothetical protein
MLFPYNVYLPYEPGHIIYCVQFISEENTPECPNLSPKNILKIESNIFLELTQWSISLTGIMSQHYYCKVKGIFKVVPVFNQLSKTP